MTLLTVVVAVALGSAPDPDVREQVNTLLHNIDSKITADQWKALGPEAATVLMEVASSGTEFTSRRARAVEALGMRKDEVAADRVAALASDPKAPKSVRIAAVRAVSKLSPAPAAQATLENALKDNDVHVRAAAAKALTGLGSAGCAAVQTRMGKERGEERALIERESAACKGK